MPNLPAPGERAAVMRQLGGYQHGPFGGGGGEEAGAAQAGGGGPFVLVHRHRDDGLARLPALAA